MTRRVLLTAVVAAVFLHAETPEQRGKRVVDECIQALGGDNFLNMQNRVESGRAYSFYREKISGLSIATIYTHYDSDVKDTAQNLAQRERDNFGKKQDYGTLFTETEGWDITFRGARPLTADQFARYKDTTMHDIFYILRVRMKEPGWIVESKGADVFENRPVEIVDLTDANDSTTTVYFDQTNKVPLRQVFYRRDPITKDRNEEVTHFTNYRDAGEGVQWPIAIERDRNGEKIYEIFSESVRVDDKKISGDLFSLPSTIKLLKPE